MKKFGLAAIIATAAAVFVTPAQAADLGGLAASQSSVESDFAAIAPVVASDLDAASELRRSARSFRGGRGFHHRGFKGRHFKSKRFHGRHFGHHRSFRHHKGFKQYGFKHRGLKHGGLHRGRFGHFRH